MGKDVGTTRQEDDEGLILKKGRKNPLKCFISREVIMIAMSVHVRVHV